MSESKESKAKCVQYAEEGILGAQYTMNGWFVKIKPVLSMDGKNEFAKNRPSVIFSFVKKGTSGTGFDIYMDVDTFDNWADDVLDATKTFKKTIEAEKQAGEKYPKTYKYVTGENGQKSVGFCPSTLEGAFCTINGTTVKEDKKVYANIPVDLDWIRTVCKKFKRVFNPWFEMMAKLTYANSVSNYNGRDSEEDEKTPVTNNTTATPNTETKSDTSDPNLKIVEVQTLDPLKAFGTKGNFWLTAADIKNKQYNFVFKIADMKAIAKWEKFKKKAEAGNKVRVTLKYNQIDTACYVKDIL